MKGEFDERNGVLEALISVMVGSGLIVPASDDPAEAALWTDAELASFVENRFHLVLEPPAITESDRRSWRVRALAHDERLTDPRSREFITALWITDGRRSVGTLAVDTLPRRGEFLRVWSLYVFPEARGRGLAGRVLQAVQTAAVSVGLPGIRVSTHWTWQRPLRLYLSKLGMWVCSFKRSIDFLWAADLPVYSVQVGESSASFSAPLATGEHAELITAARDGDRLRWHETPLVERAACASAVVPIYARATLALAVAMAGWPLLRSRENFETARGWDLGGPEVLAWKIGTFEALDRRSGFDVQTPRIPGLPYDEITLLLG